MTAFALNHQKPSCKACRRFRPASRSRDSSFRCYLPTPGQRRRLTWTSHNSRPCFSIDDPSRSFQKVRHFGLVTHPSSGRPELASGHGLVCHDLRYRFRRRLHAGQHLLAIGHRPRSVLGITAQSPAHGDLRGPARRRTTAARPTADSRHFGSCGSSCWSRCWDNSEETSRSNGRWA